jgi:3-phenylpropionate/cinnamic acid dioxygenase small subunit
VSRPSLDDLLLAHEIEAFFAHEAELLDSRCFEDWLDLLADDIRYWMPLARNQPFGEWEREWTEAGKDLNWFDEGKFELEQRVKQIMTGLHWAEEPVSRTTHLVANVRAEEAGDGTVKSRCRFIAYRNRTETETDFFVGKRHDRLRRDDATGFKIAAREIYLDQNVLLAKNLTIFF